MDDKTLDDILGKPAPQKTEHKPPADITEKVANPTKARTEKSNPSAPFSNSKERFDAESFEPERTDPPCGSRFKKSKRSGRPRSRSSPPVIKRGRPRTSSRRKTNIEKKEGKCNGELRQSVFKSAAVQRATL